MSFFYTGLLPTHITATLAEKGDEQIKGRMVEEGMV